MEVLVSRIRPEDWPVFAVGDADWQMGLSRLHVAAQVGLTGMVESMLSKGADLNARNDRRQTPFHYAARYGKSQIVQLLAGARR